MIKASNDYALCEHVEGRNYRVVLTGSRRKMDIAYRAAKRDKPDRRHFVFLTVYRGIGDLVKGAPPR